MDRNTIVQWLRTHPDEVESVVRDAKILNQWEWDSRRGGEPVSTRQVLRGVLHPLPIATVNLLDVDLQDPSHDTSFAYVGTVHTRKGPQVVAHGTDADNVKHAVAQALVMQHGWAARGQLLEWIQLPMENPRG